MAKKARINQLLIRVPHPMEEQEPQQGCPVQMTCIESYLSSVSMITACKNFVRTVPSHPMRKEKSSVDSALFRLRIWEAWPLEAVVTKRRPRASQVVAWRKSQESLLTPIALKLWVGSRFGRSSKARIPSRRLSKISLTKVLKNISQPGNHLPFLKIMENQQPKAIVIVVLTLQQMKVWVTISMVALPSSKTMKLLLKITETLS